MRLYLFDNNVTQALIKEPEYLNKFAEIFPEFFEKGCKVSTSYYLMFEYFGFNYLTA